MNCINNQSWIIFLDAQETGFIKDINEQHPNGVLVQHGEYQYEAPNGELVKVQYTADGNILQLP